MSLFDAVMTFFPTAIPGIDFELRDDSDGQGPQIVRWDAEKLGKQPTAKALKAASDAADARRETLNKISALESSITSRRIREAMLTDAGKAWLEDVESQIATLRGSL